MAEKVKHNFEKHQLPFSFINIKSLCYFENVRSNSQSPKHHLGFVQVLVSNTYL